MALKALLLRSKLEKANNEIKALRAKDADFEKREAELEAAIKEVTDETSDEDRTELEKQVENFQKEKEQHEEEKGKLEDTIKKIEEDISEEERRSAIAIKKPEKREGREVEIMKNRTKFFGMSIQERDAFFAKNEVKDFLMQVRTCIREKRALNNIGLTIPEVMLELLKEKVQQTSKLINKVNFRPVAGTARQRIMGTIPEAVWTEMCAILNEMNLGFNDVEIDGYKVGGFFAVCNAIVEDNDVNLTTEILNALGKAIGKAIDKAIIYGKGTKMPLGIVTRLAQTSKPSDYSETAREWKNLSTTNIIKGTGATGLALFKEIVAATSAINNDYSEQGIVWIMNKKTHTKLMVQSMDKNLNAAIVAGIDNSMPVIGGEIVELPFIPEDNIIFGYFDMYLLAERAGTNLAQSEHARFLEDQTVFKGTGRYDGCPVIPEAFAILSITAATPVTEIEFAPDKANETADTTTE